MEENNNPNEIVKELFRERFKINKQLSEDYDKLYNYILPLIENDDEIKKLVKNIELKINMELNLNDVMLSSTLLTVLPIIIDGMCGLRK